MVVFETFCCCLNWGEKSCRKWSSKMICAQNKQNQKQKKEEKKNKGKKMKNTQQHRHEMNINK